MARRAGLELFVSRLSFYTTTEDLKRLFSPFGVITRARLVIDPRTQRPKGFGFVKFESQIDAHRALKAINGRLQHRKRGWNPSVHYLVFPVAASSVATKSILSPTQFIQKKQFWGITTSVIYDSKMPTTFTAYSPWGRVDVLADTGGAEDDFRNARSGGNGGGRGNDDGDGNNKNDSEGESDESNDENLGSSKKKTGMSMSQKITLGYAILVGTGGLMGFLKSGSHKSLISGVRIALNMCCVYLLLPGSPAHASAWGLGTSSGLLISMGTRFQTSGEIFPAWVLFIVSFFMSVGYLHGLLRMI